MTLLITDSLIYFDDNWLWQSQTINRLYIDGFTMGLLLTDSTGGEIGVNHIHGKVQFVPEKPIFYEEILAPYKVKTKSYCLDLLYENLFLMELINY